jgi:hypothetical protein
MSTQHDIWLRNYDLSIVFQKSKEKRKKSIGKNLRAKTYNWLRNFGIVLLVFFFFCGVYLEVEGKMGSPFSFSFFLFFFCL